ncbi:MAG TPA: FtsQ-type POTRA domain-containing protein [Opitutales bacterium]|jgi:cell division septal protein FtsQ|nr:FtsQ-type POTRA domain-containing protein [Opitutales bacterium]
MKKSSLTAAEGLRTWQDIGQQAAARAISPVARRNRHMRWLGWGMSLVGVMLLAALCIWAIRSSATAPLPVKGQAVRAPSALVKFEFKTDGVLTDGWVMNFLNLHAGDSLDKVDVFNLRTRLLSLLQIKDVSVERELPDTLRISVSERKPWLRVAVDDGKGGFQVYLVSRDGTVFAGQDFPDKIMNGLPWMSGMNLHRTKDHGFQPVPGMDQVADLLAAARTHAPKIAAKWTVVNLSKFDPRPETPAYGSLIKVESGTLGELTFAANIPSNDFESQIKHLAFVAEQLDAQPMVLRGLDLSLGNQVVVQPLTTAPVATRLR